MNEDELRARLNHGIAAPPAGAVERVIRGARARALEGRRPGLAAVFAVAVAVAVLLIGGTSLFASLKAARVPAPVAPLGSPSPGPSPVDSPSPAPSPTTVPTPVTPPPGAGPLVVLPTSARVIPVPGSVVWVTIFGSPGDLLYRSQDQGASWQRRTLPADGSVALSALSFVDTNHGWYVKATSPATQCAGQAVQVWRTSDGAATWQNLGVPTIAFDRCNDSLSFVDSQTGFMTGSDRNQQPVLYRTGDGGVSWTESGSLPDPPDQRTAGGASTVRAGNVSRFGTDLLTQGRGWQHLYAYRSRDGGATWSWVATVPGASDGELSFLDTSHWWLSGPGFGPNYRYTSDAGGHYAQAPGAPNSAAPISPVFTFVDLKLGYATVRGSIWKTLDGGTHWTTVSTPGT